MLDYSILKIIAEPGRAQIDVNVPQYHPLSTTVTATQRRLRRRLTEDEITDLRSQRVEGTRPIPEHIQKVRARYPDGLKITSGSGEVFLRTDDFWGFEVVETKQVPHWDPREFPEQWCEVYARLRQDSPREAWLPLWSVELYVSTANRFVAVLGCVLGKPYQLHPGASEVDVADGLALTEPRDPPKIGYGVVKHAWRK